jgi:hypothetical protein
MSRAAASALLRFQLALSSRLRFSPKNSRSPFAAPSPIPRRRNLPMIYTYNPSVMLPCHFSRRIRGGVIHHDNFIRLPDRPRRFVNCLERARETSLLVMSRNDERNRWICNPLQANRHLRVSTQLATILSPQE